MITNCPHCTQNLELDSATLAAMQGTAHFQCPACGGVVPVPTISTPQGVAPKRSPGQQHAQAARPVARAAVQAHRGINRNLLILGALTLLTLGGLAIFLASRNGGDFSNTKQNITDQNIHNSYFTQLIASGATTEENLKAITEIRPYGDGFIGISKEPLTLEQALDLARRTGADILEFVKGAKDRQSLINWLSTTYPSDLVAPVWIQDGEKPGLFETPEILAAPDKELQRRVLLYWFDPGPLVFEETLTRTNSLDKFFYFHGSFDDVLSILPGMGMRTTSESFYGVWWMAWAKAVLGDRSRVEFDVEGSNNGQLSWVMKGSGTGNSPDSGYAFRISKDQLTVRVDKREWISKRLPGPLAEGKWVNVQTDINGAHVAVRLNGTLVASGSASEALTGPLHGWFGISGTGVSYRNVRVWSSEKDQGRERQFSPPVTVAPRPNGELIYTFSEPEGRLGARWSVHDPDFLIVAQKSLLISASRSNRSPLAMLDLPLTVPFAVEVQHEFPTPKALNFELVLATAKVLPHRLSEAESVCLIMLPGKGFNEISRAAKTKYGDLRESSDLRFQPQLIFTTALTPFYAPIQNRKYLYRVEVTGDTLRVFQDGGLLIQDGRLLMGAKRPPGELPAATPVFLGLGQFLNNSKIDAVRIYRLKDE